MSHVICSRSLVFIHYQNSQSGYSFRGRRIICAMFSTIICCVLLFYFTYRYLTSNYNYWKVRNVPYEAPTLVFGNIKDAVLMRKPMFQLVADLYQKFSGSPYIGFYKMRTPCLLLTDPDHIDQAFVHDSDFFTKNEFVIDPEMDPIAGNNAFFQHGQKWKKSRGMLTPLLSSAKMKHATPFFVRSTQKMLTYIEKNGVCEARNLLTRYVADASALSGFGVEGESFEKDDAFFRKVGERQVEPDKFTGFKLLCMVLFPDLAKMLNLKFIPDDTVGHIRQIISTALRHRKEKNINNNDFLDSVMALKNDTDIDDDVIALSIGYFIDPNTSNQGSYVLYALATHPEIQEKLKVEIDQVLSKHNGEITYDAIREMNYLDCVISETLRLYPSLPMNTKRCTGYYEFPLEEGQKEVISLEPGMSLAVSVVGLHHDERYFENPLEFIPERFSEKNKGKIRKGTYIPFGLGKRICAGMRLANMLMKVSTVAIVKDFKLTLNEKTTDILDLNPKYGIAVPKCGLWINFSRRDSVHF